MQIKQVTQAEETKENR